MALAPLSVAPSLQWDGNDGWWSTFAIRVGTPAQTFRVLPSTAGQEIWVPVGEGCTESDPTNCAQLRGAFTSLMHVNASSSWKELGIYDLVLNEELNYHGNGLYGLDTVGLQLPNSGGVELPSQVVAGIATTDFFLGTFGLGPRPINFSNFDNPMASFMQSLKDQKKIASLSYGYTAGAAYRKPTVFGSLTLGGYDESRLERNQKKYPFDADDSRPLSIFIESISASNSLQGRMLLLENSHRSYASIDSTVPHLWLPREVCDRFEQAFGLLYDPATDLYRVNHTARDTLLRMNVSITVTVGLDVNPTNTTTISLPYKAFDLQASHPLYPNATYYFPIRRAAHASQYRLGRVFLQEAYLITDYERSEFSLHQARFETPMPPSKLVPISSSVSLTNSTHTPNSTDITGNYSQPLSESLSKADIAGIAVGIWAGLALGVISLLLYIRHLRRRGRTGNLAVATHDQPLHLTVFELDPEQRQPKELLSEPVCEMYEPPREIDDGCKSPVPVSDDAHLEPAELGSD